MSEPANKLCLNVIKDDCPSNSCPYRYGDDNHSNRLLDKIHSKLKYRVADGNEVRRLLKRVGELELALKFFVKISEKRKLYPHEIAKIDKIFPK